MTEEIVGVVSKIADPVRGGEGDKKWVKQSFFVEDLESGDSFWISHFGVLPEVIQKAFEGYAGNPPMEVKIEYEVKGKYRNFKDAEFVSQPNPPKKEVNSSDSKLGEFTPASEPKLFRGVLLGEALELLKTALMCFELAVGRPPKSDGEFAVVNTVQIFLQKHWVVERWLRSKDVGSLEEVYAEANKGGCD